MTALQHFCVLHIVIRSRRLIATEFSCTANRRTQLNPIGWTGVNCRKQFQPTINLYRCSQRVAPALLWAQEARRRQAVCRNGNSYP